MAWSPQASESENILFDCSVLARQGVRFDLLLSDRQLSYSRVKAFAVSDPLETVTVDRNSISDVTLKKLAAWPLRIFGVFMIAGTFFYVLAFAFGQVDRFHFGALLGIVLGGACFVGSSNRWQLEFRANGKRHRIAQPAASKRTDVEAMATALNNAVRALNGAAI